MFKYYLIYQITNKTNGMIYIGCHVTNNPNDNYMGSGTQITEAIKKEGREIFTKEILYYCDSEEEMLKRESELVNKDFIARNDTYNVILGGRAFLTTNTVTVKDQNDNVFQVDINDSRYLNGELIHINKGKVVVKDKNNNTFQVDKNDPRYLNGELVPVSKGTVTVKDQNDNIFQVDKDDERYLNGELISINKGKITVKDQNDNVFQVDKNDPRYLNGELVHYWTGKKHNEESKAKISRLNQETINQRLEDYYNESKTYGYKSRLARKWGVLWGTVSYFIKHYA